MTQLENTSFSKESELYFTSPACDIYYNNELKVVETNWKGLFSQSDEFREILGKIIELLALKKSKAVIADARNMKIISVEDQQWIIDDWQPRAVKAGFRMQALIVTKNSFNELSIKKIVKHYDPDEIITGYFLNHKDAVEWVRSGGKQIT